MVNRRLVESNIVEMLMKSGAQDVKSILEFLRDRFDDTTEEELNKALMTLELHGIIRVYNATKDKQRVELVRG